MPVDNVHNLLYNIIGMKEIRFSKEKDEMLRKTRGVGFEEIAEAMENGYIIQTIAHPNQKKYPNQKIALVKIIRYIYVVPYIENENDVFLKTIYPSRKYTKKLKIKL